MAKIRHEMLNGVVLDLLDGSNLSRKIGTALELVSIGPSGWPHPSLLSVGEVLAVSPSQIRLALWAASTTAANLRERPEALVTLVAGNAYYGIQLTIAPGISESAPTGLGLFQGDVVVVHEDRVDYAEVTSGISYRLHHAEPVLDRWGRTHTALRGAFGAWNPTRGEL